MFVFTARAILDQAKAIRPDLVDAVSAAMPGHSGHRVDLAAGFAEVEAISIDHAVMEHTDRSLVVPIDVGWSDVGSWEAVWESSPHDASDNVLTGQVTAVEYLGLVHPRHLPPGRGRRGRGSGGGGDPGCGAVVPRRSSQLVRDIVAAIGEDSGQD